jgi:transposase
MSADGPFELHSQALGALPIVGRFLERMRLAVLLERYLPDADRRCALSASRAIGVLVRNLCVSREPLYGLGDWAARHDPRALGFSAGELLGLNDDRVGRALDRLFDADRASLLTDLLLGVICEFGIDCSQLHNDSTTISVHGSYTQADGRERAGNPTIALTHGHSKDHRPDLKQLMVILTVSADGSVPLAGRVCDGNTSDVRTHIETWEGLRALVGREDFLYVADCKLVSRENLDHIDTQDGRFLSVLPRSRPETARLTQWTAEGGPQWREAARCPAARKHMPDDLWSVTPAPITSTEGYRLVWVHSTRKHELDQQARHDQLARGLAELEALAARLAGPRCRFKERAAVEHAAAEALRRTGTSKLIDFQVTQHLEQRTREEPRPHGRIARRRLQKTRFTLHWQTNEAALASEAAAYGCFALITNDQHLTDTELLAAYRYQPNLEKRHHQLKSVLGAAPIYLKSPARIEALITCQFIALLTHALIERELRHAMTRHNIQQLPIYPERRTSHDPTAARIFDLFADLQHHRITHDGATIQHFPPTLSETHQQLLTLLSIPPAAYRQTNH